jgi:hypothetical protein
MDIFVHGTEDALPDDGRVDRAPIVGAAALFMLQKPGELLSYYASGMPTLICAVGGVGARRLGLGQVRQPLHGQRGRAGRHDNHGR